MARVIVLVVLVILWRFAGVVRMAQGSQVVRLLLGRRGGWVGLLLDGRERNAGRRWRRCVGGMLLLLLLLLLGRRRRLLLVLHGSRWRRRRRVGRVVVLGLRVVGRWRSVVTGRRLCVGRAGSDRFHDERKMQPCGQGWCLGLPAGQTIGGARAGRRPGGYGQQWQLGLAATGGRSSGTSKREARTGEGGGRVAVGSAWCGLLAGWCAVRGAWVRGARSEVLVLWARKAARAMWLWRWRWLWRCGLTCGRRRAAAAEAKIAS